MLLIHLFLSCLGVNFNYLQIYLDIFSERFSPTGVNSLRPRQNGCLFADDLFKCIFLNENVWISIKISLKFVPKGPINNILVLVQIMAWRRPGDKALSESMIDYRRIYVSFGINELKLVLVGNTTVTHSVWPLLMTWWHVEAGACH